MEQDRKEMDRGGRDPPVWEPLLLAVRNTMRPTSEAIRSLKKSNKISKKKRQNGEKRNATELFCFFFCFVFFIFHRRSRADSVLRSRSFDRLFLENNRHFFLAPTVRNKKFKNNGAFAVRFRVDSFRRKSQARFESQLKPKKKKNKSKKKN